MRMQPPLTITTLTLLLAACSHSARPAKHTPTPLQPYNAAAPAAVMAVAVAMAPRAAPSTLAGRQATAGRRAAKIRQPPHQKPQLPSVAAEVANSNAVGQAPAGQAPAAVAAAAQHCVLPEASPAVGFYARDARPKGQVALTFDDGPHPSHTPKVLDLLRRHNMHATFFVVGAAIRPGSYHLIQRMVAEGHTIGSHSYNHDIEMASRRRGRRTVEYVRGQHEVTRILIDLALLAQSAEDFVQAYQRVFERQQVVYMPSAILRQWPLFLRRHHQLLSEAGYAGEQRPYEVLYSRPPGGGPYLGPSQTWQRALNDTALREAGLVNVMWHDESGDTKADKSRDFTFLTNNLQRAFKRGGVVLIHDFIRQDALATALTALAKSTTQVVPLGHMVEHKYHCEEQTLRAQLKRP